MQGSWARQQALGQGIVNAVSSPVETATNMMERGAQRYTQAMAQTDGFQQRYQLGELFSDVGQGALALGTGVRGLAQLGDRAITSAASNAMTLDWGANSLGRIDAVLGDARAAGAAARYGEGATVNAANTAALDYAGTGRLLLQDVHSAPALRATAAAKDYGVAFFGEDNLRYYTPDKATIGRDGRSFFMMPLEDAAIVRSSGDAARYTGMAPSAQGAYLSGGDTFGLSFPTEGMALTRPTAADAMGWPHYLEGGNTAVRLSDGPNAGYLLNPTREFVTPGGNAVPNGSVLFKLGTGGEWMPIKRFEAPGTGVINSVSMRSPSELMGVEPASARLLDAVGNKRSMIIAKPGSEELRMLDYFGAEASVGGVNNSSILLRENPSKAAVLEEFLHGTQSRLGIVDRLGTSGFGSAETHVKDFMIRHQSMLGLSAEDIRILQILREKGL
jgi:hypothetical protein